jgi:hypothetical protein
VCFRVLKSCVPHRLFARVHVLIVHIFIWMQHILRVCLGFSAAADFEGLSIMLQTYLIVLYARLECASLCVRILRCRLSGTKSLSITSQTCGCSFVAHCNFVHKFLCTAQSRRLCARTEGSTGVFRPPDLASAIAVA